MTHRFIAIDAGTVTASHLVTHSGVHRRDEEIGQFRFFVHMNDLDGGTTTLWSGADYEEAIRTAERSRIEWEIDHPVHDNVAGGGR